MSYELPTVETWVGRCADDGEFRLAMRGWNGGLRLRIGDVEMALHVTAGRLAPGAGPANVIGFSGSESVWDHVLAAIPSRFNNDLMANISSGLGLVVEGEPVALAQYYAAAMRAVELLRPTVPQEAPIPRRRPDRFDTPTGRYVHLDLEGHDHRIYFEEAGQGIPLLLQHTAGCHGGLSRQSVASSV